MKRMVRILLLSLLLAGCGAEATVPVLPDPVPDQELNAAEGGLSLALEGEVFSEPLSSIRTTVKNATPQPVEIGEFYALEMKKDGKWHAVVYSDAVFYENDQFRDFGELLEGESEKHQEISFGELGVTLTSGEYRLVKTFLTAETPLREISAAAEFTVE